MIAWLKKLFSRKPKISDKDFFNILLESTSDWWDIRHYGNCLRFSLSGYTLSVDTTGSENAVVIRAKLIDSQKRIVLENTAPGKDDFSDFFKSFLACVFNYLEMKDPLALSLWIRQLRSSERAVEEVNRKVRTL